MAAGAATLWGINATVSKVILSSGISSLRLSEVRTAGAVFALASAVTYALYILLAEHAVGDRDAVSLLAWGFGFAAVFWAVIAPWWTFPTGRAGADVSLLGRFAGHHAPVWALMAAMIVVGTIVPFFLLVSALRH